MPVRPVPMQEDPMTQLSADESAIVDLVRDFVDKDVRPVVRELEHAPTPTPTSSSRR